MSDQPNTTNTDAAWMWDDSQWTASPGSFTDPGAVPGVGETIAEAEQASALRRLYAWARRRA